MRAKHFINKKTDLVKEGWNTGEDRVSLPDTPHTYWSGTGALQKEYDVLYNELVPSQGKADTIEGEVLRASSKIVYRHYNDGDEFNQASFDQLEPYIGSVTSYDDLAHKAIEFAVKANGNYTPNPNWDSLDVMDYGPAEEEEYDDEDEEDDWYDEEEVDEGRGPSKGLHKKVTIVKGRDAGKTGYVRQIKTDKLRNRVYLDLDLEDGGQAVVLKQDVRLVKEVAEGKFKGVELDEGITEFISKAKDKFLRLKDALSDEWAQSKEMWEIVQKGDQANPKEMNFANNQFKDILRTVGLTAWYSLPIPGNTLLILSTEKILNRFGISIMPDKIKNQVLNVAEARTTWNNDFYVYDPETKAVKKKFRTHKGAKQYAEANGLKVASAEYYHDTVSKEVEEGWESGPEERTSRDRDPDDAYDARRQEKADAEADRQQAQRPQEKYYTLVGRGPNMEPNYAFPGEYATQDEADAARSRLMADPKTPNPRDIGISKRTRYLDLKEGISSSDPLEDAVLSAVQELIQQGHTEVAPEVITNMVVSATGKPFLLKDLVDANNNSQAIQHYVNSINPTKVKFSNEILTVKNEDPMKDKQQAQDGVSKMANRAAGRDRSLAENVELARIRNLAGLK